MTSSCTFKISMRFITPQTFSISTRNWWVGQWWKYYSNDEILMFMAQHKSEISSVKKLTQNVHKHPDKFLNELNFVEKLCC